MNGFEDPTAYQPSSAMTWTDYFNLSKHGDVRGAKDLYGKYEQENPNSFGNTFLNFFSGERDKYWTNYQNYLDELARSNEFKSTQSARAWDEYMDSTKYQRAIKDLEAAGLNPWLAIQSGVQGSGATSAQKGSYKYNHPENEKKNNSGRDLALLMFAVARIIAMAA